SGNAQVYCDARVSGNAQVYGDAQVYCDAQVYGDARVYCDARVSGNAQVYGGKTQRTDDYICVGPIGSRLRFTTVQIPSMTVVCGCFNGTFDEFKKKVKVTHENSPRYLAEYKAMIALINAVIKARK
ncbi:MAG: hypothetical protein WCI51_08220, partial [Lentisphaerota bacterium]